MQTVDAQADLSFTWMHNILLIFLCSVRYEPRSEKTGLRGFQPGPTQTGLYSYRRWLEA